MFAAGLRGQADPAILPLSEVRAGMRGTGKTVFQGTTIEDFSVEILGVLENVGPRQAIILARLSGGPLEKTGVMQGMSGSPVYIGGKLAGAVAMAFPFSKEPIAGIRPIEEMLSPSERRSPAVRASLNDRSLVARLPRVETVADRPVDISTPLALNGFTRGTVDFFAPQLRAVGLELRQALSGGRAPRPAHTGPPRPGSMISVQLLTGDMAVGADGTVTHVSGKQIWAFGHRFLAVGATELPFSTASVLAVMPNVNASFKISASGEWLGAMTADGNAAVSGEIGRRARTAPIHLAVRGSERNAQYRMQMVQDPLLSPLLLQMAIYSALDASERTLGSASVRLRGTVRFDGITEPLTLDSMYSGDYNVPLVASMGGALPVAYALQNSVDPLRLEAVDLTLESDLGKRQFSIEQVWTSPREVRPGEAFEICTLLAGEGGRELVRKVRHQVPIGAQSGPLQVTVSDGPSANAADGRVYSLAQPRPADQVLRLLNSLRGGTRGYVRLWRPDPAWSLEGYDLPDPPPSVGLMLARSPGAASAQGRSSTLAEYSFDADQALIMGSKTIQVDIRE